MKDLVKLYSIYSVSRTEGEKEICDWICSRLDELKISYERLGNTLYHFVDGNNILLSAHLDQVSTKGRASHIYKQGKYIFAYNDKWQRTSLGCDDKNGVWIILKLLEAGNNFDFIISECEECGGDGIKKVEKLIDTSSAEYCLVLDRQGNTDILNKGGATTYCQALAYNLKNFWNNGYSVVTGGLSDTQTICKYKESVNMSVAYFNPHTATEYTDFERLTEIKDDIQKMFNSFVHYPSKPSDYTVTYISYTYNKPSKTYKYNDDERWWD